MKHTLYPDPLNSSQHTTLRWVAVLSTAVTLAIIPFQPGARDTYNLPLLIVVFVSGSISFYSIYALFGNLFRLYRTTPPHLQNSLHKEGQERVEKVATPIAKFVCYISIAIMIFVLGMYVYYFPK